MIVLITGGRDYAEAGRVCAALDVVLRKHPGFVLWCGGCSGADALALSWASARGVAVRVWPAEWARFGRSAGPRRNRAMVAAAVASGSPVGLVAFPGGRGTAHCCSVAVAAGVPVWAPFG